MSFASKRPFESNALGPNRRGKWRKTSSKTPLKIPLGAVVFRILCPVSKSGGVIGKGGGIISRIRQETGAKVRLEEIVPGCEERVIVITGANKDAAVRNEHGKEGNEDASVADADQDDKVGCEKTEVKDDPSVLEGSKFEKATSSAQKALLLVFERMLELEAEEADGVDKASEESTVRLLIVSSQVGCLLGKGGNVIKQMISDSGAEIRVLPKDKIPYCASSQVEIVQIAGGIDSVKNALQLVSQLLIDNPPCDQFPTAKTPGPPVHSFASVSRPETRASVHYLPPRGPPFDNRPYAASAADIHPFAKFHDNLGLRQLEGFPEQLIFRLLCTNDKVGSVIGRGGGIVRTLQQETGCEIKILETNTETDDRVIIISSPVLHIDKISPAQDGLLRVLQRIAIAVPDSDVNVISRLLVSSNQIGCLLGKGGSVISEMRKICRADIRILNKDQIPKSVQENDEVVQVTGELRAVQEALLHITDKLKIHLLRIKVPSMNHTGYPASLDPMHPFGASMGRRETSPPRMFGNLPPFQKDIVGCVRDERASFAYPIHGHGVPPHGFERIPPAPWAYQGIREGAGSSIPMPHFPGGAPHKNIGGFSGGNHPAVITSTTVDVVVPRAIVPSIYGEDGGCLRRIQEISEAKITITEPRPEATETVIIISGTPEQTHAARSLIQAFVLSETSAS